MNNSLTKKESIIVHSISCLYDEMYSKMREKLESMSVDDLKDTIEAYSKVSDTNCAWTAYQIKNILLQDAEWILRDKIKNCAF